MEVIRFAVLQAPGARIWGWAPRFSYVTQHMTGRQTCWRVEWDVCMGCWVQVIGVGTRLVEGGIAGEGFTEGQGVRGVM